MDLVHPLDGLDVVPWASSSHAYGDATDLPELLRALTRTDQEAAGRALSDLYGSVLHQGTVYAASAVAAPFLARIAAAGHRTAEVLGLLGGMAESEDEYGVARGAVRTAVAGQVPLLLPLLADADPDVRRTAAWAVSHTRVTGTVLPALCARWEEESAPAVRSELLAGIARLDLGRGAAEAAGVLDPSQPPGVRLAAVHVHLDAGVPWTGALHDTMLSLLPADSLRSDLDDERGEPLAAVVEALLRRGGEKARGAAFALVDTALRDDRAEVREEGLWAAECASAVSRAAPHQLLEGLRAAAVDETSVVAVAPLLGRLGPAAAPVADVLAPLAGRNPDQEDDHADRALAALVRIAPERAAPLLAAGLGRRPRALGAAAGPWHAESADFPYDSGLLDAVRSLLSRPTELCRDEPARLMRLLAGWGADAVAALPELCAALPYFPGSASRTLAAVAAESAPGDRATAVAALAEVAATAVLPSAKALYDLTGDPVPLLRRLERELGGAGGDMGDAARAAAALGRRGAALEPLLRAALSDPEETLSSALDTDTALAEALWRVTGDPAPAVAVLESVLTRAAHGRWSRWSVIRAARTAALLGPAGRPLLPALEAALDDPTQVPAVVLALIAVSEPTGLDRAALAGAALTSAELDADPTGACEALEALVPLEAPGATALDDALLRRLTALAEGDARVVRSGKEDLVIEQDETFRHRTRALLAAFTATAAATTVTAVTAVTTTGRRGAPSV
ncbi:hypothetical protein [Streptomyces sp. NPDC094049]|uniref:hypothetical protein n=1 Tax=Streptomyces sp. NPDC094049 TaxID=3154987 RepID=UPI00331B321F